MHLNGRISLLGIRIPFVAIIAGFNGSAGLWETSLLVLDENQEMVLQEIDKVGR